jgi:predicted nucleic acid-binding protein
MTLLYADSSALLRAYFADEDEHVELRNLLLGGREPVVTSEITRLELASAVRSAYSSGRVARSSDLLGRIDGDLAEEGAISPIDFRADPIVGVAYRFILEHRLRPLDAIHLAVCVEDCPGLAGGEAVVFVTRDADQAAAARALGLAVR